VGFRISIDGSHEMVKVLTRPAGEDGEEYTVVGEAVKGSQLIEIDTNSILLKDGWKEELVQVFTWAVSRNQFSA